jgi:hypothetical protein
VVRLIPPDLMQEYRAKAAVAESRPTSRIIAVIFVSIWLICFVLLSYAVFQHYWMV